MLQRLVRIAMPSCALCACEVLDRPGIGSPARGVPRLQPPCCFFSRPTTGVLWIGDRLLFGMNWSCEAMTCGKPSMFCYGNSKAEKTTYGTYWILPMRIWHSERFWNTEG